MSVEIKIPKKLIEVALPLDAINSAATREKSIRHGHPSTLHLWWARRPLAAARAVIFSQLVNDPGFQQGSGFRYGVNKEKAQIERERLFKIIEDLVKWENSNNREVLDKAYSEILRSWVEVCDLNKDHPLAKDLFNPSRLPEFHDPFAGGGAIPLEAQRLGLNSYGSDLNPIAVAINKAMIEIPPNFSSFKPVGPIPSDETQSSFDWVGSNGLAEDVRRYGIYLRTEAMKKIGKFYPQVEITQKIAASRPDLKNLIGQKLTVITWIWARTVKSPNPAFSNIEVPLASTFVLCSKPGKECYIHPEIVGKSYKFTVKMGIPPTNAENGTKLARGANFQCLLSNTPIEQKYIRDEFKSKRDKRRLMAIVAEGPSGRIYLSPESEHEDLAEQAIPTWKPEVEMNQESKDLLSGRGYGFKWWYELFTSRQLLALTVFSDLVNEIVQKIKNDAVAAGMHDDNCSLNEGGKAATAYAQAVGVYLAFVVDKCSDYWSTICTWHNSGEKMRNTFGRQAIPMTWDFAEANPFCDSSGNWMAMVDWTWKALAHLPASGVGFVSQADAQTQIISSNKIISTDPPYYDNISYADLSDFFYIWLRRSLKSVYPNLFSTLTVPKAEELIASPYRHGGKAQAEDFFLNGMTDTLRNLSKNAHPAFPVSIYYAFKQSETKSESGTSSTGWETFLEAVLRAGFALTGTWPMRTELGNRMIGSGTNALASSIVLVCRKRPTDAPTISRREFIRELNSILPNALSEMTQGGSHSPIAPVDLSQAIIGPGMAIFSKYSAVIEADGKPMRVRTALQLINRFIAEDDFDLDTQFCLNWFETNGWAEGPFGQADVLARAKGTSVEGLRDGGVANSSAGKFSLIKWQDLDADWSPETDNRTSHWEMLHHLIRAYNKNGESSAGEILAIIHSKSETIRALAYRLYTVCERKKYSDDAANYNNLILAWEAIEMAAQSVGVKDTQISLFDNEPEPKETIKKTKRKK